MPSASSLPHVKLDGLAWPLALLSISVCFALAAQPADGDLEAALAAMGVSSLVAAVGCFTVARLGRRGLTLEQAVGAVPAAGIALLSIPSFLAALTNLSSFELAIALFLAAPILLLFVRHSPLLNEDEPASFLRDARPVLALALLAVALAIGLLVLAILSPRHLDGWGTAAIMRAYRDATDFSFTGDFRRDDNAWPALLAYLSWLFQVDTLVLYRTILPPLVVTGAMLSFWALARTVFRSTPLALLAVALQALILLTSITAFGFQPGWQVLFSAAEDKTVAAFVLLPVAVMYLIRLFDETDESWAPFALLAAAIGVIHPVVALLLAMLTTTFLVLRLLLSRAPPRSLVIPFAVVCLALVPSLLVFQDVSEDTEGLLSPTGEFFVGNRASLEALKVINFLGNGWAVVHPRTILTPLLLAGGVAALLAFLRPRIAGMQYIMAASLVVGLVAFNPLAIRALSYLVTTQLTWRITWLLPAALGLTLAFSFIASRLRPGRLGLFYNLSALAILATIGVALLGPWTNRVYENLDVTDAPERELWEAPPETAALARALRAAARPGDVVLAPPAYNAVLPAFTSYPEVVQRGLARVRPSPELGERSDRFEDVVTFYLSPSIDTLLEMRDRYSVDFVVLEFPGLCEGDPIAQIESLLVYAVDDDGC